MIKDSAELMENPVQWNLPSGGGAQKEEEAAVGRSRAASSGKGSQGRDALVLAGPRLLRPPLTLSLCSVLRNETVLHQFCCPAADAEQKPACSDLASQRWECRGDCSPSPTPTALPLGAKHTTQRLFL